MKLTARTIPHETQRYPTVGDWWIEPDGAISVRVSDMGNQDHEFCVAVHELIEAYLCRRSGVDQHAVTTFDMQFEKDRALGYHRSHEEPGDHPDAPYRLQHKFATAIERMLIAQLGIGWDEYEKAIEAL